jgi:hypothetical protein
MTMKVSTLVLVSLACLMMGLFPGAAQAQAAEGGVGPQVPHNQVISANPFLLLWEWANVEYERKVSTASTVGVAGSWVSVGEDNETYQSLNGFYRYYPQEVALKGFYLGGRLGYYRVSDDQDEGNAFGLGFDIGYTWIMGSKQKFYIGMGIGATRLFGGNLDDGSVTVPSLRLINLGVAF